MPPLIAKTFLLCSIALAGLAAGAADSALGPPSGASGQKTATAGAETEGAGPDLLRIEAKLALAREQLAGLSSLSEETLTNAPEGMTVHDPATRRGLQERLVRLLEQQLSTAKSLADTKARRPALVREAQGWTRFEQPPPYSILLLDMLHEQIEEEQRNIKGHEEAARAIDFLAAENRSTLSQAEEGLRRVNEQLELEAGPAIRNRLSWQRDLESLRSQVAVAMLGLLDLERQLRQESLAQSRIHVALLQRQMAMANAGAEFTQADLDKVLARVENDRLQFERELAEAGARSTNTVAALEVARQKLNRLRETGAAGSTKEAALAAEEVAAREAQFETTQSTMLLLRLMLEYESLEGALWQMRFAAHVNRTAAMLRESSRRLEAFTRRLELWKDYEQQQFDLASGQLELQEARLRTLRPDSEFLPAAQERLTSLKERQQMILRVVQRLRQAQRLTQRWAEELRDAEGKLPFFARVTNVFSDGRQLLLRLWRFELFTAEDTIEVEGQKITGRRSVTLGKIVLAVLILVVGIMLTRFGARVLQPVIIRRLRQERSRVKLVFRWLQAFLVACLVMFSLVLVKIPLTVFAFAGGALAIGLGFGMQTLLKNFVSGLILLFERPFRIGDVLEVNGQRGTVTEIGLRSSVLQLWDGTETLIPNSSLLENNVSNWTYSNRKVRFSIQVGAAYGSDTRRVLQVLSEAAERHGLVEKEPQPQALFTEFADSALTFELRFWVDVIRNNAAQVGSDLRLMIAGAFAEQNIVIAFPQRDLHLDAARPLPVEIVSAESGARLAGPRQSAEGPARGK